MFRRQWSVRSNDTFYINMNGHTAVEHHGTLYSFGGYRDETILDTVFRLVEYYWTDEFYWYITEFSLKKPRYNHRTVVQVRL